MPVATSTILAAGLVGGALFNTLRNKSPKTPTLPAVPAPPPPISAATQSVDLARKRQRVRSAGTGRQTTLLTGPMGLNNPAPGAPHTLLGS